MNTLFKATMAMLMFLLATPLAALAQHEHHMMNMDAGAEPAAASEPASEPVSLEGELVCASCYQDEIRGGSELKSCVKRCYGGDEPLGLVTSDGALYRLVPGERQTNVTRLANMAVDHGLMMVEMPLMVVNELTDFKAEITTPPNIKVKRIAARPRKTMLGKQVQVRGRITEKDGIKSMVYSEFKAMP